MKIIKVEIATLKRGRRMTIELAPGETILIIRQENFYRLGGEVNDVVAGHVLAETRSVYWCSITQKWEYA